MMHSTSLLHDLLQLLPTVKSQTYFKNTLTALSHAMEDLVLAGDDRPLVIANFQQERFYRQETRRYQRIAEKTQQVYILAMPETDFASDSEPYATIGLEATDELAQEWHLIIVSQSYSACLICREQSAESISFDAARQFQGFWTFDPSVSRQAAQVMLERIVRYRPDLTDRVEEARSEYGLGAVELTSDSLLGLEGRLFCDRLVTYLQASQYKQVKLYSRVVAQAEQEKLVNVITAKIRQSLKLEDVVAVAVSEISQVFPRCHCEMSRLPMLSRLGSYAGFRSLLEDGKIVSIADVAQDSGLQASPEFQQQLLADNIRSCLLVPILYQQHCLAILELHCEYSRFWPEDDREFLSAIAIQVGWGLKQAETYVNLALMNEQLSSIEQMQRNLIAIVGHELRTPLSTIQVCLESLATEPDMPGDVRQVMLDIALSDSERLRKLVQDFLLLSQLESGQMSWQVEPIVIPELISLAMSNLKSIDATVQNPIVSLNIPEEVPIVISDGEAILQLLMKLFSNALNFTPKTGSVQVNVREVESQIEIQIADTGCGIEPSRLESIFDRFYQEESFLQRSVGGAGLGLAICQQLVRRLGGRLWATSEGKGLGSQFFVRLPLDQDMNLMEGELLVG
jgi:DICT domain-containing protein/signal transduction histidine kinase